MENIRGPQTEPWGASEQRVSINLSVNPSCPAHLLQNWIRAGPQRVVFQEEQQRWAFIQFPLQEAGLCSRRLQPPKDVFVMLKHPVADGF